MKTFLLLAAALVISAALIGCAPGLSENPLASQPAAGPSGTSKPQDLVVLESGYYVNESENLDYGVGVKNLNADYAASGYTVTVIGRNTEGEHLFTSREEMGCILPGEIQYFGGNAGRGIKPDTVEFTLTVEEDGWKKTSGVVREFFSLDEIEVVPFASPLYSKPHTEFTGKVTLISELEESRQNGARVSLILRDADSSIIYGRVVHISDMAIGKAKEFRISDNGVVEFAEYELHSIPW